MAEKLLFWVTKRNLTKLFFKVQSMRQSAVNQIDILVRGLGVGVGVQKNILSSHTLCYELLFLHYLILC